MKKNVSAFPSFSPSPFSPRVTVGKSPVARDAGMQPQQSRQVSDHAQAKDDKCGGSGRTRTKDPCSIVKKPAGSGSARLSSRGRRPTLGPGPFGRAAAAPCKGAVEFRASKWQAQPVDAAGVVRLKRGKTRVGRNVEGRQGGRPPWTRKAPLDRPSRIGGRRPAKTGQGASAQLQDGYLLFRDDRLPKALSRAPQVDHGELESTSTGSDSSPPRGSPPFPSAQPVSISSMFVRSPEGRRLTCVSAPGFKVAFHKVARTRTGSRSLNADPSFSNHFSPSSAGPLFVADNRPIKHGPYQSNGVSSQRTTIA